MLPCYLGKHFYLQHIYQSIFIRHKILSCTTHFSIHTLNPSVHYRCIISVTVPVVLLHRKQKTAADSSYSLK